MGRVCGSAVSLKIEIFDDAASNLNPVQPVYCFLTELNNLDLFIRFWCGGSLRAPSQKNKNA